MKPLVSFSGGEVTYACHQYKSPDLLSALIALLRFHDCKNQDAMQLVNGRLYAERISIVLHHEKNNFCMQSAPITFLHHVLK